MTLDGSRRTLRQVMDAARTWPETWRAAVIPRPGPAYEVAFHRFVEVSYGVVCALAYTVVVDRVRRRRRRPADPDR